MYPILKKLWESIPYLDAFRKQASLNVSQENCSSLKSLAIRRWWKLTIHLHSQLRFLSWWRRIYAPISSSDSQRWEVFIDRINASFLAQIQRIYDQAFDLYAAMKVRGLSTTSLSDYGRIVIPEPTLEQGRSKFADYSTDIHQYLDDLQQSLLNVVRQPMSIQQETIPTEEENCSLEHRQM